MFEVQELLDLIADKPKSLELVITGRYASEQVMGMADNVIEFQANKHYFKRGAKARIGISE